MPAATASMSRELAKKGLITRTEAAKLLGLSRSAVRKMEGIHVQPIAVGGAIYYSYDEVSRVLGTRSGSAAQIAFSVFASGGGPTQVVIEHAVPPELAERLHELYLRLRARDLSTLIFELPAPLTAEAWKRAHRYSQITGSMIRAALELCARRPELHQVVVQSGAVVSQATTP